MRARHLRPGAVLLAALALAGCSRSDVEAALARELRDSGAGPDLAVSAVHCSAPASTAGLACTVTFHEALALAPVSVQLAPSRPRFPAAFRLTHGRLTFLRREHYWVSVETPFDGVALHRGLAAERLAATARAAQEAAVAKLGHSYHARVAAVENRRSYTQD